jgi:hypothetical protein
MSTPAYAKSARLGFKCVNFYQLSVVSLSTIVCLLLLPPGDTWQQGPRAPHSLGTRCIMPVAVASLVLWYGIATCFFFRRLSLMVTSWMTPCLSPKAYDACSTFIPMQWSMYQTAMVSSTMHLHPPNSAPYIEVLTAPCRLLDKNIGICLTKTIIPVTNLLVTLSWARSWPFHQWVAQEYFHHLLLRHLDTIIVGNLT